MRTPIIPGAFAALGLLVLVAACERERPAEEVQPAAEAAQLTPEQEMQTSLTRLVEAQGRHFEDHQRYADSVTVLMDEYGFQPVGDAQVAISFAGTGPEWGYVGSSVHPFSNQECEVLHGMDSQGRSLAGRIECEGATTRPPMPDPSAQPASPGAATPPGAPAPPGAPGEPAVPGTPPDSPGR